MLLVKLGVLRLTVAFALRNEVDSRPCGLTVLEFATLLQTLLGFAASWQHYHKALPAFGPPVPALTIEKPLIFGRRLLVTLRLMRGQPLTSQYADSLRQGHPNMDFTLDTDFHGGLGLTYADSLPWTLSLISGGLQRPAVKGHCILVTHGHMVMPIRLG